MAVVADCTVVTVVTGVMEAMGMTAAVGWRL